MNAVRASSVSSTNVTRPGDAWNRAQIFIDGAQIAIGHVLIRRPRHDLEQRPVEWRWKVRMQLIRIDAGPNGLFEFLERVAADRQASVVRCQVAGDDVNG